MQRNNGFTLIELIVAIALLAVLLSLVIPSYRTFIQNNQRASAVNELVGALKLARAEAITRSQAVSVCRSNTPGAAAPTCGGGTGWENGWIIFLDNDADGILDAGETPLRVQDQQPAGITLRGTAGNVANAVIFQPSGIALNPGNPGTITFCDSRGYIFAGNDYFRTPQIEIWLAGRIRNLKATAAGSCT